MSDIQISSTDILELFNPADQACADALMQMRELFPGVSDSDLARFIIARKFVVEDASKLLAAHLEWRAATPKVVKADCLNSLACKNAYSRGFDREGHPLLVFLAGKHNPKTRDLDETNRMLLFWMQHALAALPDDRSKFTVLIDRTGAGVTNQDIDLVKSLGSIWQDNFPERVYRFVVYPTGMVFYGLWKVVQFLLDPVTKDKVKPCYYASDVAEFIDPQYLPTTMNGTCTFTVPDVEEIPESPHVAEMEKKE